MSRLKNNFAWEVIFDNESLLAKSQQNTIIISLLKKRTRAWPKPKSLSTSLPEGHPIIGIRTSPWKEAVLTTSQQELLSQGGSA